MTDLREELVRLLKLGDENAWREAFQPLYAVAWKASCKLGFSDECEARGYAFEFLKKLPYKISNWKVSTWGELKANVIADILQTGIAFLEDLSSGTLKKWKEFFSKNAEEARQRLVQLLVGIKEIIRIQLSEFERKLFKDHFILRKGSYGLASEYEMEPSQIKQACAKMIEKVKEGLHKFGLGWVLQG
jgi:hypothetical protein